MHPPEPPSDCRICPRLAAFRSAQAKLEPGWFNKPVPSFGDPDARLLIVGLAPGLKGANRTGRPFTGDYAGDLLYATLLKYGFATGTYAAHIDDGLTLKDCLITNAVRCVPPQNKPLPVEESNCRPFLKARINSLPRLSTILALGKVAHDNVLRSIDLKLSQSKFAHAAQHQVSDNVVLFDSYHCSRYNTNTGRLTERMFHNVFDDIVARLKAESAP